MNNLIYYILDNGVLTTPPNPLDVIREEKLLYSAILLYTLKELYLISTADSKLSYKIQRDIRLN